MRILIVLAFIGCGIKTFASDFVKWHQGVIVMTDGEVRQGELAFQVSEIVLFRTATEVAVFTANKVQSFRYFDEEENINRKFVSHTSSNKPSFYEIVVWGDVSVLRKLNHQMISNRKISDKDDFDYFICTQNQLVQLSHFRNKVYPRLISSSVHLRVIISKHHLNPNVMADAIQIIQLYNRATSEETLVAGI